MTKVSYYFPLIITAAVLAGCATPPQVTVPDPSMMRLAAAAELAQQDLHRLSRAENALAEARRTEADRQREAAARANVLPGFERTTHEVFTLPYPAAIERVSALAGYRFVSSMALPTNPQVVSVDGKGKTLHEIMMQITDSMPSDVTVHVWAAKRHVVLAPRR